MTASFKGLCLGIKGSLYKPVAGCYLAFRGFLPPALPETKDLSGQPLGVGGESTTGFYLILCFYSSHPGPTSTRLSQTSQLL